MKYKYIEICLYRRGSHKFGVACVHTAFNLIQQKSPTSVSGEMNAYWYSIQWGFKPRLNKVKASDGCHRFSEEIYRA
ncbi:hypothetical protein D5F11_013865 [Siminovitchia terrae]|uniref:Uncharacterized protein n=1 Tax=Siminovitchia terrae TaxID=1914933 RepID=A0A429X739_SIMTE|nr:hypothetical protein [Siminovitchia terrae]RST59209.1 hypothetical protein D5F11_013865 [Siminovitchia terrae]